MLEFECGGVCGGVACDYRMMPDVVRPVQTHSCNVGLIGEDGAVPDLADTDAVICLARGLKIGVRTADCVPIVVYAPDIRAVAAIHAGWKGTIGGIASKTLQKMQALGANLELAEAAFGPCICGECYEISEDLARRFCEEGYADCMVSYRHVDLEAVNRRQLLACGVQPGKIHANRYCTYETASLPSWRRNPTDRRLLTWITM